MMRTGSEDMAEKKDKMVTAPEEPEARRKVKEVRVP
jgi:hypothetical protein